MSWVEQHRVVVTVAGGAGAGVGYTPTVRGRVLAIRYTEPDTGGFDAGVGFDVTAEQSGLVLWDEDSVDASKEIYPRVATHDVNGVAAVYASGGEPVLDYPAVAQERVKISVANGGADGKYGTFDVYIG